jgi:hypothetical protein
MLRRVGVGLTSSWRRSTQTYIRPCTTTSGQSDVGIDALLLEIEAKQRVNDHAKGLLRKQVLDRIPSILERVAVPEATWTIDAATDSTQFLHMYKPLKQFLGEELNQTEENKNTTK